MRTILLTVLLCLAPSVEAEFRHFNQWTDKEKLLFAGWNTVSYVDYRQTTYALNHPCNCYEEANPLHGSTPSNDRLLITQVIASSYLYWMVGASDPDRQNTVMLGMTLGLTAVVIHNDSVGIEWEVAF